MGISKNYYNNINWWFDFWIEWVCRKAHPFLITQMCTITCICRNIVLYLYRTIKPIEIMKNTPSKNEITQEMELHNADEVGINNQWTFEDAEYHLLLSDKYHNLTKK